MLPLVAAIVAVGCVSASFRRLWFAMTATRLDPSMLASLLKGEAGRERRARLADILARREDVPWERAIFQAIAGPALAEQRAAIVNEQLQELDWRVQRWARVPRVCASIATSTGLLLATLALRAGLTEASDIPADMPVELRDAAMQTAVTHAIDVAAIGLAGAAFCIAIQYRARQAAKERAAAADRLVERLEALAK